MTEITQGFGATVMDDRTEAMNDSMTHIVACNPKEYDAKGIIEEEERREREGGNKKWEMDQV